MSDQSWRVQNMSNYWEYQIQTVEDENPVGKPTKVNANLKNDPILNRILV